MEKDEIIKLVDALYSIGYVIISFRKTSLGIYFDVIEFDIFFNNKSIEDIPKLVEIVASCGYEIILLDKTAYKKAVVKITPIRTESKS